MKDSYKGEKSKAMENNYKYMPKGVKIENGSHASKPGKLDMPIGHGFKEVDIKKYPMSEYPKKAMDY